MAASIDQDLFCREDLTFVKDLPDHVEIECPVCLQVMLTDPHLVTCCGHHFCGPCIERVQNSYGPCPMCKEKNYQAFIDKKVLRIINSLLVYCTNKQEEDGCQWKGNLKSISTHLNKGKRQGECQFEKVKCQHEKCQVRTFRCHLDNHEKMDCPHRPCQYCGVVGEKHHNNCVEYNISCPNKCQQVFPCSALNSHLSKECPLQPVECPFSWAGCTDKPLRKDSQTHTTDLNHMSLLAVACGQLNITCKRLNNTCHKLKKENEDLAATCGQLKKSNEAFGVTCGQLNITCEKLRKGNEELSAGCSNLKKENKELASKCSLLDKSNEELALQSRKLKIKNDKLEVQMAKVYSAVTDNYPILPITIKQGSTPTHIYTHIFGHHISLVYDCGVVSLAFHEGKFDKLQHKVPKISIKCQGYQLLPIVSNIYKKIFMHHDILVTNKVTPGVLNVRLGGPQPQEVEIIMSWT